METVRVTFFRADGAVIVAADVEVGRTFDLDGPFISLRMRVDPAPAVAPDQNAAEATGPNGM